MSDRQYSTMLALLILPPLVALIAERMGIDESSATGKLYHSEFYEKFVGVAVAMVLSPALSPSLLPVAIGLTGIAPHNVV